MQCLRNYQMVSLRTIEIQWHNGSTAQRRKGTGLRAQGTGKVEAEVEVEVGDLAVFLAHAPRTPASHPKKSKGSGHKAQGLNYSVKLRV